MPSDNAEECLVCYKEVFPTFVKWKTYAWITGFVILGIGGSYVYTTNNSAEHKVFSEKTAVAILESTVNIIENKQVSVITNQGIIKENQKHMDEKLDKIISKL